MSEYAGSEWIEKQLSYSKPGLQMSEFGKRVADLLGELFKGIYHVDQKALFRVDWAREHTIELSLGNHELATFDFDELSRLVFLAHHFCMRISINPVNFKFIKITFCKRTREGDFAHRHPTLNAAVSQFSTDMVHAGIPEFLEKKS